MKKMILLSMILLTLSAEASTNVYLNITGAELNRRMGVVTNLETAVLSAGLADIGFVDEVISASFTNANFGTFDLSPYVGANEALVVMRVEAIAASTVSIRTNGDTNNVDLTSMNGVVIGAGETAMMVVKTDSDGLIDVKATANTALRLVAFIRRHVFD